MPSNNSDIDALGLADYVRAAALRLRAQFPQVRFTSGRRDNAGQASAMAGNVVLKRRWIERTYKASKQRDELQAWVDANSSATTQGQIAAGLLEIMNKWTITQIRNFSRHLSGEAFDVQPVSGGDEDDIKAAIRALPNLELFLEKEGDLVRWHAQFKA